MKKTFYLLSALTIIMVIQSCKTRETGQSTALSTSEAMNLVISFEEAFNTAHKSRNFKTCEQMLGTEFTLINPSGKKIGKDKVVKEDLAKGQPEFGEFKYNTDEVTVYDNTILASGSFSNKGTLNGMDISGSYRFTKLYVSRNKQLQLVSTHLTKITE